MQIIAWIAICLVTALILRRHPVALVGVAFAIRVAVPSVAASFVTGLPGSVQIHPGTYFVAAAVLVMIMTRGRDLAAAIESRPVFSVFLVLFAVAATIITSSLRGPQSMQILADTLLAGIGLLLLARAAIASDPRNARRLALTFVGIAVAEGLIAIVQWSTRTTFVWESYMYAYYWYSPTGTPVTGTIGALLDVALLCAVAIPLVASIRSSWLQIVITAILVAAVLATERRTPLIVAVVGVAFLLLSSRMTLGRRILSVATVVILGIVFASGTLGAGVLERFQNDQISGEVRNDALIFFLAEIDKQPWHGTGFGSSDISRDFGLKSSFESGYLMYAWDFGVVLAIALLLALLSQLVIGIIRGTDAPGAVVAYGGTLFLIALYSGLETPGPAAWVLFLTLGICTPRGRANQLAGAAQPENVSATVEEPAKATGKS